MEIITKRMLDELGRECDRMNFQARKVHGMVETMKMALRNNIPGGKWRQGWKEQKNAYKIPIKVSGTVCSSK